MTQTQSEQTLLEKWTCSTQGGYKPLFSKQTNKQTEHSIPEVQHAMKRGIYKRGSGVKPFSKYFITCFAE